MPLRAAFFFETKLIEFWFCKELFRGSDMLIVFIDAIIYAKVQDVRQE